MMDFNSYLDTFRKSLDNTLVIPNNFLKEQEIMKEQQDEAKRLLAEFQCYRATSYSRLMKQIDRELGRNVQSGGWRKPYPASVLEYDKHHRAWGW